MKLAFLAVPVLAAAMLAGCSGGGGGVPDSVTAPGPNAADADAAAAIPSCGEESMLLSADPATYTVGDVTTVFDTALTAVDPVCGQESAKISSGKQQWVYYYAGGDDVAGQLLIAFARNDWSGDANRGYLTLVEASGNNRTAHIFAIPAESATAEAMESTFFLGLPDELVGTDVTIVTVD